MNTIKVGDVVSKEELISIKEKGLALLASSWRLRRKAIILTAIVTLAMINYEIWVGATDHVHEITMTLLEIVRSLLLGWILGSVVEDGFNNSIWNANKGATGKLQSKAVEHILKEEFK